MAEGGNTMLQLVSGLNRDELIELAKLCEYGERYEDMAFVSNCFVVCTLGVVINAFSFAKVCPSVTPR